VIQDAIEGHSWALIVEMLQNGWYEPVSDDDLFEVYCLTVLLEALDRICAFGPPSAFGLNMVGRPYIAQYDAADGSTATVYFQQTPVGAVAATSRYSDVTRRYEGLNLNQRRPDILLHLNINGQSSYVLFECKNTLERATIADGVYQVFAYMNDFASLWPPPGEPRAALLISGAVALRPGRDHDARLALIGPVDGTAIAGILQTEIHRLRSAA
jgi:hypothetical protein